MCVDPERQEQNWNPEREDLARMQIVVPVLGDFKGVAIQGPCKDS